MSESKLEIVGLFFGKYNEALVSITDFKTIQNVENSPISFSIDYSEFLREIDKSEKHQLDLVGIFHTHPIGQKPYPSKKDKKYMCYWPILWGIGTLNEEENAPVLNFYVLVEREVKEIPYSIVNRLQ